MSGQETLGQLAAPRRATVEDLDTIMGIYGKARQIMRDSGNTRQWVNGYPSRNLIEGDIERGESFVIEDLEGTIHAVFMFSVGDDPTYSIIEDGAWLNDNPYGVIHRIASDGLVRGILAAAVTFARNTVGDIRIDTHADNAMMQRSLQKAGFERCGIIYCQDGTPRIAFQLPA